MSDIFINEEVLENYLNSRDSDPCLCGSGRRFIDCHKLTRREGLPPNKFQVLNRLNRLKKPKQCFNQNDECSETFTNSHSIPRQSLENIQRDRHIFKFQLGDPKVDYATLETFSLSPTPVGINEIGCYHGFCNFHDTKVFAPIEVEEIVPTSVQLLLTRYRAITKEIYNKSLTTQHIPIMKDVASTKESKREQTLIAAHSAQLYAGTFRSLTEYHKDYKVTRECLNTGNLGNFRTRTYILDEKFPVHTCACANPLFSPSGRNIQDWDDFSVDCQYFSMNSFFRDGKTFFIFTWPNVPILNEFFSEFSEKISGKEPDMLVQFAFAFSENHAFQPSWWEALPAIKQRRLARLFLQDIVWNQVQHNPFEDFRNSEYTQSRLLDVVEM